MKKKESGIRRNYNLDLLRIISMLMIITVHYCTHGYYIRTAGSIGSKSPMLWQIYSLCYCAVNIYVLISGYFLCKSEFKWKKVLKLIIEVLFYSIIIGIIFFLFHLYDFNSLRDFLRVIFPIMSNTYWFISIYLVLYIASPYLNKFIKLLDKKEYQKFIIINAIIFLLCNNLIPGTNLIDTTRGYGLLWFIFLYFVSAYIRLYDLPKIRNIYYLILYFVFSYITYISRFISIKYLSSIDIFRETKDILFSYNSITMFLSALCLFLFFKNIDIKPRMPGLIEKLSIATFGVYLIHDNFLLRTILYDRLLKVTYFMEKSFFWKSFAMGVSVFTIFYICSCIEMIRESIFKKLGI